MDVASADGEWDQSFNHVVYDFPLTVVQLSDLAEIEQRVGQQRRDNDNDDWARKGEPILWAPVELKEASEKYGHSLRVGRRAPSCLPVGAQMLTLYDVVDLCGLDLLHDALVNVEEGRFLYGHRYVSNLLQRH